MPKHWHEISMIYGIHSQFSEPKSNKQDTVNPVYNPLRELVGVVDDVVCYKCGDS